MLARLEKSMYFCKKYCDMNEDTKILKMPLGIQSFEEIRNGSYIYVDKTDYVWKIANGKKFKAHPTF